MAETHEARTDRLAEVCTELVDRLRTEPAEPLLHELLGPLERLDLYGIAALLAAATDPTYSTDVWWGWVRYGVTAMTADPVRWDDQEDVEVAAEPPAARGPDVRKTAPDPIDLRIAELAAKGLNDRQIGAEVGRSRDAVEVRRRRMGIASAYRPQRRRPAAEAVPEAA